MTAATNAENLRQYKSRFYLIADQTLAFTSSLDIIGEAKNIPLNLKQIA